MIKNKINNKVQTAINFTTGTATFLLTTGLTGSYELDKLNTIQFITNLLISLIGCFVIWYILTYINHYITSRLIQSAYKSNITIKSC